MLLLCIVPFLLSFDTGLSDREIKKKIISNVKDRVPDAVFDEGKDVTLAGNEEWSVRCKSSFHFGKEYFYVAKYRRNGKWRKDKVLIGKRYTKELRAALEKYEILDRVMYVSYFVNPTGNSRYQVRLDQGEYLFLDDSFKKKDSGLLYDGLKLSPAVKHDLEKRYPNYQLIQAQRSYAQKYFEISYLAEDGGRKQGKAFYNKRNEWVKTKFYYGDYLKLPIDLLSYVADKGGINNFHTIRKIETPSCKYFVMNEKGGGFICLDMDMKEVDKPPCDIQ